MDAHDTISTAERTIVDFRPYKLPGIHRLGRYAYKHAHRQLETHIHEGMMEICYCDKGVQVYEVGGKKYQIRGGDVFITFPGEPHSSGDYPEEKGVLYWLIIKIPTTGRFLHYEKAEAKALLQALKSLPARHFRGQAAMKKMLDELFALHAAEPTALHRLAVTNLLTSFLLSVIQSANAGTQAAQPNRAAVIKQYIEEHIHEDLSIDLLARQLHLSAAHFKSWFKKEIGMPPLDYILRYRIEEAKKLLHNDSSKSIADIAYLLCFSSSQYFATVFKKYTGSSPASFRDAK